MSMNDIIAEAWTSTERRYLVTTGATDGTWIVYDKAEECVAFHAVNGPGKSFTAHEQCEDFVEVACSQAVVVALREAGYLPV